MKVYKSFLAAALALTAAVPLTGCAIVDKLWPQDPMYEYVAPDPTEPADSVVSSDPEEVYSEVDYIPEMFYGSYVVDEVLDNDPKSLADPLAFSKGKEKKYSPNNDGAMLTALPYRIEAGPHTNVTDLAVFKDYNWMTMYVVSKEGEMRAVEAAYTIDKNSLVISQLVSKNIDPANNIYSYQLASNPIRLSFKFNGTELTLSHGLGESVTLHAEGVKKDGETGRMTGISVTDSNLVPGSDSVQNITSLSLKNDSGAILEEDSAYPAQVKFGEDGFCELEWNNKKSKLLYFYGGADGLVFSDGEKNYNYTARSYDLYASAITGNVANAEELSNLSQEEIRNIAELSQQLNEELKQAFAAAEAETGLKVDFNEAASTITLNSVKSFEFSHSELNSDGQNLVDGFLSVFAPIICNDKYYDIISKIVIEGHTDPKGSPGYNMTLSQNRAAYVLEHTLSPESGLSQEYIDKLAPILSSVGQGSGLPIYNPDNSVNYDLSRRVVYHFYIGAKENVQEENVPDENVPDENVPEENVQ